MARTAQTLASTAAVSPETNADIATRRSGDIGSGRSDLVIRIQRDAALIFFTHVNASRTFDASPPVGADGLASDIEKRQPRRQLFGNFGGWAAEEAIPWLGSYGGRSSGTCTHRLDLKCCPCAFVTHVLDRTAVRLPLKEETFANKESSGKKGRNYVFVSFPGR